MKIGIFGPNGMLGSAVAKQLSTLECELVTIGRTKSDIKFDVISDCLADLNVEKFDYLINCVGKITHNINVNNNQDVKEAELINTKFSLDLAEYAEGTNSKLIQIATDCVFSGKTGKYTEDSPHDAEDVYGRTKSQGEANSRNAMHIRCSIIGPEITGKKSLFEWVLNQPLNSKIVGFTDRIWNGVTTNTFAKVVSGVIASESFTSGVHHLVPADVVSKYELIELITSAFDREDIYVESAPSGVYKDLTLSTKEPRFNELMWELGGYSEIPSIKGLVSELHDKVS